MEIPDLSKLGKPPDKGPSWTPYPSEEVTMKRLALGLQDSLSRVTDIFDADQQIKDLYYKAGFLVVVDWAQRLDNGRAEPTVTVIGRASPEPEHDHDRHRYEILTDVLGLGAEASEPIKVDRGKIEKHLH